MAQLTGRITIRLDGKELKSKDGATVDPGGVNRTTEKGGGRILGFTEEDVQASASFKLVHDKSVSLIALNKLVDATLSFETDSGVTFILRGAYTTKTVPLSGNEVSVEMDAVECDELT